ncbi:gluconokinase [Enterococcus sp. LJL99]
MTRLSVGIDMGTTQTKAVVFDEQGKVKTTCYQRYPLIQETVGMAEQEPEAIFQAVIYCLSSVVEAVYPQQIDIVSFSTAMHSLIVMNQKNVPLTRVITWADQRAEDYSDELKGTTLGQTIYENTGVPMHPMSPLHKIRWLKHEFPDIFQEAAVFIGIKEYIFYRLFGEYVIDFSTASGTGLFNIHQLSWDQEALMLADISEHELPQIAAPTKQFSKLLPPWSEELGLTSETIFVLGGADGPLSNLGLGAIGKNSATLTVGTSGAFRVIANQPYLHPQAETFCYVLDEEHWVIGGATSNGAGIFDWACGNLMREIQQRAKDLGKNTYAAVLKRIAEVPVGAQGLLFHPYLLGERAPLWDAEATGAFIGLKRYHTEETMMRSVIEGICLNLKRIVVDLETIAGSMVEVRATGGFADSKEFKQIMADVLGHSLAFTQSTEASAFGAVFIGWKSIGKINRLEEVTNYTQIVEVVEAEKMAQERYQLIYPLYLATQQQLSASYHSLAKLRTQLEFE